MRSTVSILKLLDRKSEISVREDNGKRPSECSGVVEFKDVDFVYPTRTNVSVLQSEFLLIFFIELFGILHLLRLQFSRTLSRGSTGPNSGSGG